MSRFSGPGVTSESKRNLELQNKSALPFTSKSKKHEETKK